MAETYFLGYSTPDGFLTHITDDIGSRKYKTFILKGGPGTGKSSLMKRVVKELSEVETPELYYCSSDPDSLDAVLFRGIGIIVVDGTSPHVIEPKYPGVSEILINLGSCWDSNKLNDAKEKIIAATIKNKKYHAVVRRYLRAIISINEDVLTVGETCLNKEKLDAYCDRLSSRLFPKKKCSPTAVSFRQITSLTPKGVLTNKTNFDGMNVFIVNDEYYAVRARLLDKLANAACSNGYEVIVSSDMFLQGNIYQHVVIPELKIAIISGNCDNLFDMPYHTAKINAMRFYDISKLKDKKKRAEFDRGVAEKLIGEAITALKKEKNVHDELESWYINAMNFDKVSAITDKLIEDIRHAAM